MAFSPKLVHASTAISSRRRGRPLGKDSLLNLLKGEVPVAQSEKSLLKGAVAQSEKEQLNVGQNTVSGTAAGAVGAGNEVTGNNSTALGANLLLDHESTSAVGRYNKQQAGIIFSVGNGTSESTRENAIAVSDAGNLILSKALITPFRGYTELLEVADGQQLPVGSTVVIGQDLKITHAAEGDVPHGVVSARGAVIGNGSSISVGSAGEDAPTDNSNIVGLLGLFTVLPGEVVSPSWTQLSETLYFIH